jgi:hypothetical protein
VTDGIDVVGFTVPAAEGTGVGCKEGEADGLGDVEGVAVDGVRDGGVVGHRDGRDDVGLRVGLYVG